MDVNIDFKTEVNAAKVDRKRAEHDALLLANRIALLKVIDCSANISHVFQVFFNSVWIDFLISAGGDD